MPEFIIGTRKQNMTSDDSRYADISPIVGKTIVAATYDRDSGGYQFVLLTFLDGSSLQIKEEGQAGEFSVELLPISSDYRGPEGWVAVRREYPRDDGFIGETLAVCKGRDAAESWVEAHPEYFRLGMFQFLRYRSVDTVMG